MGQNVTRRSGRRFSIGARKQHQLTDMTGPLGELPRHYCMPRCPPEPRLTCIQSLMVESVILRQQVNRSAQPEMVAVLVLAAPPVAVAAPPVEIAPPVAVLAFVELVPPSAAVPPTAVAPPAAAVPPTAVAPPAAAVPPTAVAPAAAVAPPTEVSPPAAVPFTQTLLALHVRPPTQAPVE